MIKRFHVWGNLLAFLAGGIFSLVSCGTGTSPEEHARDYAVKMGMKPIGVECMSYDTDGDGYVSCSIAEEGKRPFAVECSAWGSFNRGCRAQKGVQQ